MRFYITNYIKIESIESNKRIPFYKQCKGVLHVSTCSLNVIVLIDYKVRSVSFYIYIGIM